MAWSDERVELLKKLWADGLSASQIASELGGVTRNGVISKVHRLRLSGRAKSSPSSSTPRARKPGGNTLRFNRPPIVGKNALAYHPKSEPKPELPEFVIPFGQRKTLLELNGDTCSWPFGDPADFHRDDGSFYFCGGDSLTGLPYCAYHSGIAYNPGYVRMRDRPGGSKSP